MIAMAAPLTVEDVYGALRGVMDPELGGDVVELGMVADVELDDAGGGDGRFGAHHRRMSASL
ncbi:MAG: hypothetical protein KatS3mg011_1501 [Acidimicrobiia bacterium]|nr:MAG: hypothetical protein KatS3mg011_1501 [Acidimicrobiia bacterium]